EGDMAVNLVTVEKISITELNNVVAMAGIGHPPRFFSSLESKGLTLINTHAFSDHQAYSQQQLAPLAETNQNLLMTEKDAVKCHSFAQTNWWYLPVKAHFDEIGEKRILSEIKSLI
ncbi:tetraacyldisaccharide 4'-kinase, partial [Providencia rettgeri]|uniref:tetraacyldisaccharide 4'-kinase n=1 Tax=Providencia rettgeri TaxID=587 RepID=UPI0032DB9793